MNPNDATLQVSHETIYTALYAMPRGALRTELIACLRQSRKSRRPRARGEDDLIKGARNTSAVGALPNCSCLSPSTFFSIIINSLRFGLETAQPFVSLPTGSIPA